MNTWKTLQLLEDLLIVAMHYKIHYYSYWKIETTMNLNISNMKNKNKKWEMSKTMRLFSFLVFVLLLILLVFHSESEVQNVWIFHLHRELWRVLYI